jgi:hypothetical protein
MAGVEPGSRPANGLGDRAKNPQRVPEGDAPPNPFLVACRRLCCGFWAGKRLFYCVRPVSGE